jgi:hypothetical protein
MSPKSSGVRLVSTEARLRVACQKMSTTEASTATITAIIAFVVAFKTDPLSF